MSALVPRVCRVESRRRETADVVTLTVAFADDGGPAPFAPGQFSMVYAFGRGEAPISIGGDPADASELTYTIRAVGAVTRGLAGLRRGEPLGVRGPFGVGWPVEALRDRDVVIVAGGLGLAPLRGLVLHLLRAGRACRRATLLYGGRSPDHLLYRRELRRWDEAGSLAVRVAVDVAPPGYRGTVGFVTSMLPAAVTDAPRTTALLCGPEVMMRHAATLLADLGVSESAIHLSLERNMQCAVGWCGHCQLGPAFVCRDGPVMPFDRLRPLLHVRER